MDSLADISLLRGADLSHVADHLVRVDPERWSKIRRDHGGGAEEPKAQIQRSNLLAVRATVDSDGWIFQGTAPLAAVSGQQPRIWWYAVTLTTVKDDLVAGKGSSKWTMVNRSSGMDHRSPDTGRRQYA